MLKELAEVSLVNYRALDVRLWYRGQIDGLRPITKEWKSSFKFPENISQRQAEVLRLVLSGLVVEQVAQQLKITPLTVRSHLRACCKTMDACSRLEVLRIVTLGRQLKVNNIFNSSF